MMDRIGIGSGWVITLSFLVVTVASSVALGAPPLGTYDSRDPAVIRQHAYWLRAVGIDAIVIDWTNNSPVKLEKDAVTYSRTVRQATDVILKTYAGITDYTARTFRFMSANYPTEYRVSFRSGSGASWHWFNINAPVVDLPFGLRDKEFYLTIRNPLGESETTHFKPPVVVGKKTTPGR